MALAAARKLGLMRDELTPVSSRRGGVGEPHALQSSPYDHQQSGSQQPSDDAFNLRPCKGRAGHQKCAHSNEKQEPIGAAKPAEDADSKRGARKQRRSNGPQENDRRSSERNPGGASWTHTEAPPREREGEATDGTHRYDARRECCCARPWPRNAQGYQHGESYAIGEAPPWGCRYALRSTARPRT